MAISQVLLFIAAIAGLLAIVPLATWAATGSLAQAWHACKGYMRCVVILAALGLFGALAGALSVLMSS